MNLKGKNEKGITLVALVVTIVVLIILAVISINAVFGEDGIIKRAEEARDRHLRGEQNDLDALESLDGQIGELIAGTSSDSEQKPEDTENITEATLEEAKKTEMLDKTGNTKVKIGEDTVWIPAKFKVHEDSADTVDEGIVITDGTNEFVWVPVSEESFDLMFAEGEVTLGKYADNTEDDANTGATTNYYSRLRVREGETCTLATVSNGEYSSSTSTIREPDIVTKYDKTDSYAIEAGYENATKMAEGFVEDYANMRESIKTYGGFYIGRYELTGTVDNPTVKAGEVLTALTGNAEGWYSLYRACRNVVKGNNHATTMIWGCQWDETMNWLKNTKFKGNEAAVDENSSTWGNYSDSTGEAALMAENGITKLYGTTQDTGFSEKMECK